MSTISEDNVVDLVAPLARDFGAMDLMSPQPEGNDGDMVPYGGRTLMTMNQQVITAQRVAVKRHLPTIIQELNVLCQTFGDRFMYGWDVGKGANKSRVEGGTIQLANQLAQTYGNCSVHVEIDQNDTHWIFKAFFIDYEKGTSVSRLFQQRKKSGMGGNYEADRALDMVFQVGQSKAIRNVVLNALGTLRDYCVEQSRNAIVRKFQDPENRKKAWDFIDQTLAENGIDIRQVEALRGRRAGKFTVPDLARTYSEMVAIRDGMINADDVYPSKDDADAADIEGGDSVTEKPAPANPRRRTTKKDEGRKDESGTGGGDGPAGGVSAGDDDSVRGRVSDGVAPADGTGAVAGGSGTPEDPAKDRAGGGGEPDPEEEGDQEEEAGRSISSGDERRGPEDEDDDQAGIFQE